MSINRLRPTQKPISGFTIVEMLIIAPIVILVIGTFISAVVNMTGEILMTRGANALAYSIQDALNRIEADVKLSTTFLAKNSITPLTSPQGYDDSMSGFTNVDAINNSNSNMLILNTLATTGNPLSTSSALVYLTNTPNACASTQVNQNTPMTMNVIYFVKNTTLWRRTIAPANYLDPAVACATPWQQPSCSPTTSGAFCKTKDVRLVDNVDIEDFVVQYFNSASATTADSVASSTDQTEDQRYAALQSDTTVVASLNVSKTIAGRDINQSGVIRSTRLDVNASTIAPIVPDVVPAAPSGLSAELDSPGQITVSWYPNATSYTLQYDTTNSFSSPTTINSITTPNKTVSGLLSSAIYYFRVSATNSKGTSSYSSPVNQWSTIVNGIAGWWRLNGDANDSAGNSNGTVSGATLTTGQNGQSNNGYSFNGTSNYINIPNTSLQSGETFTLSVWIYPTSLAARYGIFTTRSNNAAGGWQLEVGTGNGGISRVAVTATGTWLWESNNSVISTNQWYHIVYVKPNNATQGGSLYINGTLKTPLNTAAYMISNNSDPKHIGNGTSSTQYFPGSIDDVRLYNRTLSSDEVASLYAAGAQ